jgi:hypothetical protein
MARIPAAGAATVRLVFSKAAARRLRRARAVSLTIAGAGVKTTVRLKR